MDHRKTGRLEVLRRVVNGRDTVRDTDERGFFIDNLPVRIHLTTEMILVDRPCAMGV